MGCDHTGWGGDIQGVWSYRVGAVVQGGVGTYRVGWGHTGWGGDVRSAVIQGGVGTNGVRSYRVGWGRTECVRTGWGGDIWGAVVRGGLPSGATFTYVPKGTYLDGKSRTALKTALA